MEEGSEFRHWDELIPDALALIFKSLQLQEILTVIPRVCKSWGKAVSGPYCWQEIDIEEWSNHCPPEYIDRMLQLLITRSCGSLKKLTVSGLHKDSIFTFIADHAGSLQTLRLPRSEMNDSIVEHIADRLSTVTSMDLSYCGKIGVRTLEAIGKHCHLLVGLGRNMHPIDTASMLSQDHEALAIAATMPKLKRLELAYNLISTESVVQILSNCKELEFLDLRGCWDVKLDDKMKDSFPKLKVLGPPVIGYYDKNDWDDCSDYSDASEYLAWEFLADDVEDYDDDESSDGMWDNRGRLEELDLRFYRGIEGDHEGGYGWPTSP